MASPRTQHETRFNELTCELHDAVREGTEQLPTQVPMKVARDPPPPPGIVDMTNFELLDAHIRQEFNLNKVQAQLPLSFKIKVPRASLPDSPLQFDVTGQTSLYQFRRQVLALSAGDLASLNDTIKIDVTYKKILSIAKVTKQRKGKHKCKEDH